MVDAARRPTGRGRRTGRRASAALLGDRDRRADRVLAGRPDLRAASCRRTSRRRPTPDSVERARRSVPATPVQMAAPSCSARTPPRSAWRSPSQLPTSAQPARRARSPPARSRTPPTASRRSPWPAASPQPTMCETVAGGHPGCVPLDADLLLMNGVCWYGAGRPGDQAVHHDGPRGRRCRSAVPASYEQPAQWANEFSDVVVARPVRVDRPTGVPDRLRADVSAGRCRGAGRCGSAGRPPSGTPGRWPPTSAGTSTSA